MTIRARISAAFSSTLAEFDRCKPIQLLREGKLDLEQYKSILREVYHYTKEDPQLQVAAATRLRGADRRFVKPFLGHAISEVGHDQLALNDLVAIGGDAHEARLSFPLPATTALTAFAYYTIEHRNPVGYLGYLYFLEFMPTAQGSSYVESLRNAGVPDAAMTFLVDHISIDVGHNRLMERYIDGLVSTEDDATAVVYAIQATAYYYAQMLRAAIDRSHGVLIAGFDPLERTTEAVDPSELSDAAMSGMAA